MNQIIPIILFCFSFQICQAQDTDEPREEVLRVFEVDWVFVRTKCLYKSVETWMLLKNQHAQTAYQIAKFWRRKADMGTVEYQRLLGERLREELSNSKLSLIEKEKLFVKLEGGIAESVRCYMYDHAAEIDKMIVSALDHESRALVDTLKPQKQMSHAEMLRMRNEYFAKQIEELEAAKNTKAAQEEQKEGKEEGNSKPLPSKN